MIYCSTKDENYTPLIAAISEGHLNIVRKLIENGSNINGVKSDSITPLSYAIKDEHIDIVEYLLFAGADVNKGPGEIDIPLDIVLKLFERILQYQFSLP